EKKKRLITDNVNSDCEKKKRVNREVGKKKSKSKKAEGKEKIK
ncbi:8614_t:CDS:1, partial [Acaulospora morrowiae]